jgi:hypothetical protein
MKLKATKLLVKMGTCFRFAGYKNADVKEIIEINVIIRL